MVITALNAFQDTKKKDHMDFVSFDNFDNTRVQEGLAIGLIIVP